MTFVDHYIKTIVGELGRLNESELEALIQRIEELQKSVRNCYRRYAC